MCLEYRVFGYRTLSEPGLFLWKKDLKHSIEYFVSGCLKQDKVPGNFFLHFRFRKKPASGVEVHALGLIFHICLILFFSFT